MEIKFIRSLRFQQAQICARRDNLRQQAGRQTELFKIVKGGDEAHRVKVRLGRSSVSTVEIVDGLAEGDAVILSEMSQWDTTDRVRLR